MGGNFLSSLVRSMVDDAEAADADVNDDKLLLFVLCVAVCVDDNDEGDRDKAVVVSSGGSWPTLYCDESTMVDGWCSHFCN